jgi:hypothetical protein
MESCFNGDHKTREGLPKPITLNLSEVVLDHCKCYSCGLVFATTEDLARHKAIEPKNVNCSMCSTKFITEKGMKQHFGKKHEKSRPYKCNICLKKFRNIYASRIHRLQVHMRTSRQSCPHCQKVVYNKYSLSRHFKICRNKP